VVQEKSKYHTSLLGIKHQKKLFLAKGLLIFVMVMLLILHHFLGFKAQFKD